jgi:predicted ATP-dependent serine protease
MRATVRNDYFANVPKRQLESKKRSLLKKYHPDLGRYENSNEVVQAVLEQYKTASLSSNENGMIVSPKNTHNLVDVREVPRKRERGLRLSGMWKQYYGYLPEKKYFIELVGGDSFSGKTAFLLFRSQMLSKYGNVLYVNEEEGLKRSTIAYDLKQYKIRGKRNSIFLTNTESNKLTATEIEDVLMTGKYKYVVIDSMQVFGFNNGMNNVQVMEWGERVADRVYESTGQATSFAYSLYAKKGGQDFKGVNDLIHMADIFTWLSKDENGEPVASCERKNRLAKGKIQGFTKKLKVFK